MIMLNYTVNNHPSFILHLKLCIYNHISALLRKKKKKKIVVRTWLKRYFTSDFFVYFFGEVELLPCILK